MPARLLPRFRLSPTLLAMLASGILLSGCDLWGGTAPSATASPASEDSPVVVAQMDSVSSANGSYLFGTSGRTEDGISQHLYIVDPATGQAMDGYPVLVDASPGQLASQAFTVSDQGWTQQGGDNVALFLVHDQKLYQVSLLKSQAPIPLPVSSEAHVCSLLKVIPKDGSATSSWILLRATRDATGDCSNSEQVVNKMVSSDADANTSASNADQIGQVLAVERNASGQLTGVLAQTPLQPGQASPILVQMQGDTGDVNPVQLNLPDGGSASYVDRVAGSTTQAYLRVSNGTGSPTLQVLDWSTGTPTLLHSAPAIALVLGDSTFVHSDASANYYVDGLTLYSLKPGASAPTALATLSGAPQAGGVMTSSYLVVPQVDGDGNFSLQAFSKTRLNNARDMRPITLPQAGNGQPPVIQAHNGDVLIISQPQGDGGLATLWRVDLNQSEITYKRLSDQTTLISATQAASETLSGERQQAYVIWSNAISDSALSLSSFQLSTDQSHVLSSTVPTWDLAVTSPLNITQGLLTSTTGASDTLWLFDAAQADSLTTIP